MLRRQAAGVALPEGLDLALLPSQLRSRARPAAARGTRWSCSAWLPRIREFSSMNSAASRCGHLQRLLLVVVGERHAERVDRPGRAPAPGAVAGDLDLELARIAATTSSIWSGAALAGRGRTRVIIPSSAVRLLICSLDRLQPLLDVGRHRRLARSSRARAAARSGSACPTVNMSGMRARDEQRADDQHEHDRRRQTTCPSAGCCGCRRACICGRAA